MSISTLVSFFDWSLQPQLDQMQHRSIGCAASFRLHQLDIPAAGSATMVPQLIKFSGMAKAPDVQPLTGAVMPENLIS